MCAPLNSYNSKHNLSKSKKTHISMHHSTLIDALTNILTHPCRYTLNTFLHTFARAHTHTHQHWLSQTSTLTFTNSLTCTQKEKKRGNRCIECVSFLTRWTGSGLGSWQTLLDRRRNIQDRSLQPWWLIQEGDSQSELGEASGNCCSSEAWVGDSCPLMYCGLYWSRLAPACDG